MRTVLLSLVLVAVISASTFAQNQRRNNRNRNYPPKLDGARVEMYKQIGDVKLNMYIFAPEQHKASEKRPAVIFFFGGGWRNGSPKQFEQHCKHLASRGVVGMTADYRVLSRHKTKAVACVADAKSAIRWARKNAQRLGIDPNRIAAGGGSAGGHIAGCTGTINGFDEESEDTKISSRPNAMILFNPALVLASVEGKPPLSKKNVDTLADRMGVEAKKLSPFHHVTKDAPPTLILHGKADTTVYYWTAEKFTEAMKAAGNRCELVGYEGQPHGFFNFWRSKNKYYDATIKEMDRFLVDVGFLKE